MKYNSSVAYISSEICNHLNKSLNQIYNHQKQKEGLISLQNNMINELKVMLKEWHKKNVKEDKRISKIKVKQ